MLAVRPFPLQSKLQSRVGASISPEHIDRWMLLMFVPSLTSIAVSFAQLNKTTILSCMWQPADLIELFSAKRFITCAGTTGLHVRGF